VADADLPLLSFLDLRQLDRGFARPIGIKPALLDACDFGLGYASDRQEEEPSGACAGS